MPNNIRELREKQGMGLRKLAELTGIDRSLLSKLERSMYPLYPGYKAKIEVVLGEQVTETE